MKKNLIKILTLSLLLLFSFGVVGCKDEPTSIENAIVKISSESYEYTGSAITPSIEVIINNSKINEKNNYTITYSNNTEIGIASIVVNGIGKYTGSVTKNFTIVPATINGISASGVEITYDGKPHSIIVNGLVEGDIVSYKLNPLAQYESLNPTFTNAGSYTVYYKVARQNHSSYESTANITISKATISGISASGSTSDYDGQARQITVSGLVDGDKITYSTSENGTFTSEQPEIKNAGTHKIYYKVTRANHNDYISYAEICIKAIKQTNITFENQNFLYDGEIKYININAPENSTIYYKTNYLGEYTTTHPFICDVGKYSIYFKVVTPNYMDYESCVQILITTSIQDGIEAENINVDYDGKAHSIEVKNAAANSVIYYKTNANENYVSTTNPTFVNAGNYTVYYKVVAENYADYESYATITINALNFTNISAENIECNYDGSEKSITVTGVTYGTQVVYKTSEDGTYSAIKPAFIDAGEYTIYYLVTKPNYNSYESVATIKINKLTQTSVIAENIVCDYTGSGKFIAVDGYINGTVYYKSSQDGAYSLVNPIYVDAGTYTTYYKVVRKNYFDFEGYATITINKINQTEVRVKNTNVNYDGNEHTITIEGYGDGEVYYSLTNGGEYLPYLLTFIDAGHYTIYYKVVRKNYFDYYSSATLSISKINQTGITAQNVSGNYNGTAYSISVLNTLGATVYYSVGDNENYSTTRPTFIDAGAYTVYYKVVRKNYFDFTGIASVTINTISQSGISAQNVECNYDGNAHTITVEGTHESAVIKYKIPGLEVYSETKPEYTEAGTYIISYIVSRKNYTDFLGSATVKINALKMSITTTGNNHIYDEQAHTFVINGVPAGSHILYKDDQGVYAYDTAPSFTELGKYLVEFKITCDNYLDYAGSGYMIISASTTEITFSPIATAITYGQSLTYSHLQGGLAQVEGVFEWENPDIIPQMSDSNTTLYNVIFTPKNFLYAQIVLQVTVPVEKATPTVSIDLSKLKLYADMLLPENLPFVSSVPGRIVVDGDLTLSNGKEFSYTFLPNDTDCYNQITGTFTTNLIQTEISHLSITNYVTNCYKYDELVDKDTLIVTQHYTNGDTRLLLSEEFEIEYQSSNKIAVGDSYVTIKRNGKEVKFYITASKLDSQVEIAYIGQTSNYKPLQISAQDFTFTSQNTEGVLTLSTDITTLTAGINTVCYTFTPADTSKYNTFTSSIEIEFAITPLVTEIKINGETTQVTNANQGFNITYTASQEKYTVTVIYDESNFVLSNVKYDVLNNVIPTGENEYNYNDSFTYLYIFEKEDLFYPIQTIFFRVIENSHIQNVCYTLNGLNSADAEYIIENEDFEFTINAHLLIENILVSVSEGYTYKILNSDNSEFSLTNCEFKTYYLKICVYDNTSNLVETRALTINYSPVNEYAMLKANFNVDGNSFATYFTYLNSFDTLITTIYPQTFEQEITLTSSNNETTTFTIYSEDMLVGEINNENSKVDISGYLSYGSNIFKLEISNGTNKVTLNLQVDCTRKNTSEIISSIVSTIQGNTFEFSTTNVTSNMYYQIPVTYSTSDIYNGLDILLLSNSHTFTTSVEGDIIKVNVYDGINLVTEFNIYCIFIGERNNDTTVYYTIEAFTLESFTLVAQTNQTLSVNVGDRMLYKINNEYANYSVSGTINPEENLIIFDCLGSYELTITVTATDGTTTETYNFIINVVENSNIATVTLANSTQLSLKANLTTFDFGDFIITELSETTSSLIIKVEKHLPIESLSEIASSNTALLNFETTSKFSIYKDNKENVLTSLENVAFEAVNNDNYCELTFGVLFTSPYADELITIQIECKLIFKQVEQVFSITTSNQQQTTKTLNILQTQVSGDFIEQTEGNSSVYYLILESEYYTLNSEQSTLTAQVVLNNDYLIITDIENFNKVENSGNVDFTVYTEGEINYIAFYIALKSEVEDFENENILSFSLIPILIVLV